VIIGLLVGSLALGAIVGKRVTVTTS
jgi:hypothetical protein